MAYGDGISPIMLRTPPIAFEKFWEQGASGFVAEALYRATNVNAKGSIVSKLAQVCTSTTAVNGFICRGTVLSGPSIATGATVNSNPLTITRASGSFVTDGWKVGDLCWLDSPTTRANQILDRVTAVAALTLTLTATTGFTAESFAGAAQQLVKCVPIGLLLNLVATASAPQSNNLLLPSVIPCLLPGANAFLELANGEILVYKPSRTGQGIIDQTTSLSSASYLSVFGAAADY